MVQLLFRPPRLQVTVSGLAKVAIFTTNVDAENQTLINHKCVCGALNRHFCQTRVKGWFFHGSILDRISSFISITSLFKNPFALICPSPVVSITIVEQPTKGQSILTEEILENGIVCSLPLNKLGILTVTPSSLMIICV
jgi:hypothetical protein